MTEGIIFSIEEFAVNDGPGIRTTVFLKGCPLRCVWCHNPEGLRHSPQTMHRMDGDTICGRKISSGELADKLLKDEDFFRMNDGGVTFTGGEPTAQHEFLMEVLDKLKGRIHTAIETSGYCPENIFKSILERVDFILFDIKSADTEIHKRFTGVGNALIIKNLKTLCKSGKPFVARIPLIPGINDSMENMEATRELLKDAKALQRVELLRYHKTAGAKWPMVDMVYDPPFDTDAEPQVHEIFKQSIVL